MRSVNPGKNLLLFFLCAAWPGVSGCQRADVPLQSVIEPAVEVAAVPDQPKPRAASKTKGPQAILLSADAFRTPGESFFSAHGLSLTPDQYAVGYASFLEGRAPSSALENEYRLSLEEHLLVVAWAQTSEGSKSGVPPRDATGEMALLRALSSTTLERWPDGRPIEEKDIRALYDLRGDRYRKPERVQVRMILVPTMDDAQTLLARIEQGESFGQIAASESRHESRSRFGEIDPFPRGTYAPAFEKSAFELEPGGIGVVETTSGVFIIQKVSTIAPVQIPYEQVRGELLTELRRQLREAQAEALRGRLATD